MLSASETSPDIAHQTGDVSLTLEMEATIKQAFEASLFISILRAFLTFVRSALQATERSPGSQ
jgi:hypothetical protein